MCVLWSFLTLHPKHFGTYHGVERFRRPNCDHEKHELRRQQWMEEMQQRYEGELTTLGAENAVRAGTKKATEEGDKTVHVERIEGNSLLVGTGQTTCTKATKNIRVKEMREARKKQNQEVAAKKKEKYKKPSSFEERPGGSRSKELPWGLHFQQYTPLNTPQAKILQEALSVELMLMSKRRPTPYNGNSNHYLRFILQTKSTLP
ncbi:hypothetical protein LR48_Vigan07g180300 [Vigna angularis]|uniref:Uncharacterized protein n=1 Tax=Phaseolus angularis TaxID=3914 RepID=A0A0L9V000_PHAAN|nr:hypothetical protein LR48_Vigan07g180300 [Vigna angularis]